MTSKLQNFWTSELQNFRSSGLRSFKISELQGSKTSKLQNSASSIFHPPQGGGASCGTGMLWDTHVFIDAMLLGHTVKFVIYKRRKETQVHAMALLSYTNGPRSVSFQAASRYTNGPRSVNYQAGSRYTNGPLAGSRDGLGAATQQRSWKSKTDKQMCLITRRGARASSDMLFFFRDAPGSGVVDAVVAIHKVSFATKPAIAATVVSLPKVLLLGCLR